MRFFWEIPIGIRWAIHPEFIVPRYEITNSWVLANSKLTTEFLGNLFRNDEKLFTYSWSSEYVSFESLSIIAILSGYVLYELLRKSATVFISVILYTLKGFLR